jgi:hypothetical protein
VCFGKEYETDGLIYTKNTPYLKKLRILFKWKPIEHATIDFLAKKCPPNLSGLYSSMYKPDKILYLLFSGCNKQLAKSLSLPPLKHYNKLFPTKNTIFPI